MGEVLNHKDLLIMRYIEKTYVNPSVLLLL